MEWRKGCKRWEGRRKAKWERKKERKKGTGIGGSSHVPE